MRVTLYATLLTRSAGGLLGAVSGLARALQRQGAEITVIGGADQHFEEDRALWADVPLLVHKARGVYGLSSDALRLIRASRPDIVHVNGIWTAASIYGAFNALRGGQVVVSPHGMLDPWILARKPMIKQVHAALIERPMLRRAHVHALNDNERASVAAFSPESAERTFVLPNGLDEITPSSPEGARAGTLYLGRLHPKKQPIELIEAWSQLPGREQLIVAGWGDPGYERQVTQAAAIAANVSFVGPLHGAAKVRAFRTARFFVLPSLSEGLPMAVLEALQHGCIPIITEACNLPELFRDGIAIRIQPDFSNFKEVMTRTVTMPEAERAARAAASSTYALRYRWSEIGRAMLAQYERILISGAAT